MKTRIIQMTISLTALVASFLPQKAQAVSCSIDCLFGSCSVSAPDGATVSCYCLEGLIPVCEIS